MNILSSFLIGFLSTSLLFVLSLIVVLGVKYLLLIVKEIAERNCLHPQENPKTPRSHKRKKHKPSNEKRSIEIDASQIDRIYVKKSS